LLFLMRASSLLIVSKSNKKGAEVDPKNWTA
jgi:hypothetical protein